VLKESMLVLEKLADVKAISQGGYPQVKISREMLSSPSILKLSKYVC